MSRSGYRDLFFERAVVAEQMSKVGDRLLVRAPAKINLSLLIAGKRDDGFHEIDTVVSKIDLCDELLFETGSKEGIELVCRGKYEVAADEDNLVCKAYRMLSKSVGGVGNVKITLTKNIPIGSGLGGGSSDAAAALLGLNEFAGLGVNIDLLVDIAGLLGSDIPFFLGGPLAICRGRGEKICEIKEKFSFRAILVLPNVSVSTKMVYKNYVYEESEYQALKKQIEGLIEKNKFDLLTGVCANMLERSCFQLHEELAGLRDRIRSLGGVFDSVCLSGSGSTMYCICADAGETDVEYYQSILKDKVGCDSMIVSNNRW
ncbi:MAG TPA: 4-(cytidine 5'-diphospho)-2-C-methyl-D-erythritol kinase [Phycisphaerales bacterium]|nr:4-(cytidine 5'-diphospho)-2-C-methyl-D-erythritol kinase [Phycisphaerales bacterium]